MTLAATVMTPWPEEPWRFLIAEKDASVFALAFTAHEKIERDLHRLADGAEWRAETTPFLEDATRQLMEYFEGRRRVFDLPRTVRGTTFEQTVWARVAAIPFGAVETYGDIARAMGKPGAGVAVGAANAKNPWPILVPCHRVIGANGDLRGFAYGLDLKRRLLEMEGAVTPGLFGR